MKYAETFYMKIHMEPVKNPTQASERWLRNENENTSNITDQGRNDSDWFEENL